ncbi:hypothetical protein THAOC_05269 [Thalassiosira oceanica]|uniref:Uncharacterized protein n=1 Tax=Thalassiosira oceanica TaxID=159749 RepID=K0THJ8_THAOC|nr:hypothetical protein THAOC_05269 [Thalassiosira oceanica]|eukprot:EJK73126.1 hypothetical protein THAOC_05269 [Thalassiosira oceanica]
MRTIGLSELTKTAKKQRDDVLTYVGWVMSLVEEPLLEIAEKDVVRLTTGSPARSLSCTIGDGAIRIGFLTAFLN